jgi:hypothetical protein
MIRVSTRTWTEDDIKRLAQLSRTGATVIRAAAALNRRTAAVKTMSRQHNLPLVGIRQARAATRHRESQLAR